MDADAGGVKGIVDVAAQVGSPFQDEHFPPRIGELPGDGGTG
jgi:hypothetical protein